MASPLLPHAFERLIDEDIEWLKEQISEEDKDVAYGSYDNIISCLQYCKLMYRDYGYDKEMNESNT